MSIVSNNIRHLRRQIGLTQEKMAARIGIKRSLLGAYEEARADPRLHNLQKMAEIFGVSVDKLMKEDLTGFKPTPVLHVEPLRTAVTSLPDKTPTDRPVASPKSERPVAALPLDYTSVASGYGQPSAKPAATPAPDYLEGKKIRQLSVTVDSRNRHNIEYITADMAANYTRKFADAEFLEQLPKLQVPVLPAGHVYRAFEAGNETLLAVPKGTIIIGQYVRNWYSLTADKTYVIVTQRNGILCKWISNQIQQKNALLISSDKPDVQPYSLPVDEVLEVWEAKAYLSLQLPVQDTSLDRLLRMVTDLQQEIVKLKNNRA